MGHYIAPSTLRRAASALLAGFLALSLALPAQALAWGEFTIKDEAELGKKIRMSVRTSFPVVDDPEVVRYIEGVVERLKAKMPPQPFPFTVCVVRHNAINAFAAPGGNLFIFTGLILAMEHESELAGVIGHEMAHASQRHIASRIEKMQKITLLSLAGALAGAFIGGQAGPALMSGSLAAGQASMLSYSRADETDADQVGMSYLIGAGYPPQGMVGAFEKIRRQQWLLGLDIPTYLSTHPAVGERIGTLSARIQSMPPAIRGRKDQDTDFLRIQALIRARYADVEPALAFFAEQKKGPQKCLAYMGEGIIYSRLNNIRAAESAFTTALACDPKDSLIVREAGIFHYLKGTQKTAATLLPRAVSMNPKDYMALFFYARLLADNGNSKGAQEYLKEILLQLPEDAEVHEFYGRVLGSDKQMFPAYLHMGYAAMYANDRVRTEKNYEQAKALAQTPSEKDALKRFEATQKERREFWKSARY